jgi:hypothetical protein
MRHSFLLVPALIALFLIVAPASLAQEEAVVPDEQPNATQAQGYATAIGYVYVNLTDPEPDPRLGGFGTGMFTYNAFDFSGFFQWILESISAFFVQ